MTISFERKQTFTERRRTGRAPLLVEVSMRERGRSAQAVRLVDLSPYGCLVDGMILIQRDAQLWLRLPGLESLAVQVAWSAGSRIGLEFETPLHPAVAARFMPAQGSHAAAAVAAPAQVGEPLLSRREQIIAGIAAADHSPLQRRKKPSGLGLTGRINRTVARQSDTRFEPRFADAVPRDTALAVEGQQVDVANVSASGMKISGALPGKDIGEELAIDFAGFEPMRGRLVWFDGHSAGIALPPQSIELLGPGG